MNIDSVNDNTLPDDAWKDSFDKLLDQRPVLRELNIIKRDIRASFNLNSSYENSNCDNTASFTQNKHFGCISSPVSRLPKVQYLEVPETKLPKKLTKGLKKSDVTSTPGKSQITGNPFKCTLSPIGLWEFRYFNNANTQKRNKETVDKQFNATPINENAIISTEYVDASPSPHVCRGLPGVQSRCSLGISPLAMVRNKWKSTKRQKHVCFDAETMDARKENCIEAVGQSVISTVSPNNEKCIELLGQGVTVSTSANDDLSLPPGKWRKSLYLLRRSQNPQLEKYANCTPKNQNSKDVVKPIASMRTSFIVGQRKSIITRPSSTSQTRSSSRSTYSLSNNDFKRQVLQRCGQRRVLTFDIAYNENYLKNCLKIGEGAFGEVFLYSNPNDESNVNGKGKTVLKIIPIEGEELVNGEVQKTFEQILPEVIISMELSGLSSELRKKNVTSGYVNLQRVRYVKGEYPAYLKKLWEEYDLKKVSENDHPECFTSSQQYIVLELAYSGRDFEGFVFKNAEQSYHALQQIVFTLAVGETEFQFEHRDLHWGNVLVLNTNQKYISYKLDDKELVVPTKGVQITIIDYTLSRLSFNDYCFYNDLSNDEELFIATGDYQFDIYRMMRELLNDKWETYQPKTNIFWISYIISKMINGVSYKYDRSKLHINYIKKLKQLQTSILTYESCRECAMDLFWNVE